MFIELFQRGVRTAYRALGAMEVMDDTKRAHVHGFFFEEGHDQTLVLLHGLGDASTTWYKVVGDLRDFCNIVAVDLPPYGLSSLVDAAWLSPAEQAREILPFLRKHVDGRFTVLGQSMGGWVAQWLVHEAPSLVDRAVLLAPAGARLESAFAARDLMTPHTAKDVMRLWDQIWYKRPTGAAIVARTAVARFHTPEVRGFLFAMAESHFLTDEQLRAIEVPALVVWGVEDGLLDPRTPEFLNERWGGPVERTYLARCAHLPHMERPEAVVARVRSFMEEP